MDTIEFRMTKVKYGADGDESDAVNIFVNGKNFLNAVKNFYGYYCQIIPEYLYPDLIDGYKDDFIFIYDCGCGCSGCAPFCVFIDVGEKVITWYDFMTDKEYFNDMLKENNFAMLKERLKTKGGLPPLVFDKKQYFEAVNTLRDWIFNKNFNIIYTGIEYGYLSLKFQTPEKFYELIFDELLSDPMPEFVKLYNYIQNCIAFDKICGEYNKSMDYTYEIELGDTHDDRKTVLKISAKHYSYHNVLTFETPDKEILFKQDYLCIVWAEMFKKLFSDLLNDKYFPYFYPCFDRLCESDKNYDSVTEELEELHPDWNDGDILNYAVAEGKLSLTPRYEIFLEKYRKMLTDYVVPEKWFEE